MIVNIILMAIKANPDYALSCVKAGMTGGADWVILCDTNGGCLPDEIFDIVAATKQAVPECRLGIHCHNDTGMAVANTLAAVRAGARHVQGTLTAWRAVRKCRSNYPYSKSDAENGDL